MFPELAMPVHDLQRDQRLDVVLLPRQTQVDRSPVPRKSDSRVGIGRNGETGSHRYNQFTGIFF